MRIKRNLIYVLLLLFLCACIDESMDGCWYYTRLKVVYNGSAEAFDREIANDLHLHVYKEGKIYIDTIIPYAEFKGARELTFTNLTPGEYSLVGWAIPGEQRGPSSLPGVTSGTIPAEFRYYLPEGRDTYHYPLGNLHAATLDVSVQGEKNTLHTLLLEDAICKIYLTVQDIGKLFNMQEPVWIELEGTHTHMDKDFTYKGDEAILYHPLEYIQDTDRLISGMIGTLPSSETQKLVVKGYQGSTPIFVIETQEKAVAGDVIYIEAGVSSVTITINGWQVKTSTIKYF